MAEPPRNAPCPCGSGKKYKRCCIHKPQINPFDVNSFQASFDKNKEKKSSVLRKYNSKELLQILSLLQLHPQNHGKNVRLESTITDAVKNINTNPYEANYEKLKEDLLAECVWNPYEDPPEEFFTENIVFINGNNVVYPGIATEGTEIVQGLFNSIMFNKELPGAFLNEVIPGILFILHIHNTIANKLGHPHRLFEVEESENLYIPAPDVLKQRKEYVSFSFHDIKVISEELQIPYNTIDQFVFRWQQEKLNFTHRDDNPLFKKPFVFIDNEFVLVLPVVELICLNEFILDMARRHSCLKKLIKEFAADGLQELFPQFWRMDWRPVRFDFTQVKNLPQSFIISESLWKFDANKVAYVTVLTEDPEYTQTTNNNSNSFSNQYTCRVKSVTDQLKSSDPSLQVLLVNFIHKSSVIRLFGLALNKIEGITYQIHLTPLIFQVLLHNWKFDRLTLWKYIKYLDLAEEKIRFAPLNTHLSKFDWYQRNQESFFDPDKQPVTSAFFGFEIEGYVRRNGIKKLDKIGIPFLVEGEIGHLQCYRKEQYYPVYISQEINFGILRNCLLKYGCPIWITSAKERDFSADVYINGILFWLNELYDDLKSYMDPLGYLPISIIIHFDPQFYQLEKLATINRREPYFSYQIDPSNRQISFQFPIQIVHYFASPDNLGEQYLMAAVLDAIRALMEAVHIDCKLDSNTRARLIKKAIPLGNRKMITIATGDRDIKIADADLEEGREIPNADLSYILENQVSWLQYPHHLPAKIKSRSDKTKLLNDLVSLHFHKVKEQIADYNGISLLLFLMRRHESLIQKRAFRQINYPVRQSCFGQYYDVFEEFSKTETRLNEANLCMRVLIEFVACILPSGTKLPNDDEVDVLLAHIAELVIYGSISDEINYNIDDPDIGLLPSGRIGLGNRFKDNTFKDFKLNIYSEELSSYTEGFAQFFRSSHSGDKNEKLKDYYFEKVDAVFKEEWGIALFDLHGISHVIASQLLHAQTSVVLLKVNELIDLIKGSSDFNEQEIAAYLQQVTFLQREDILTPPLGYKREDTYPWRYNRSISYLLRPIIKVNIEGQDHLLISARHVYMATENIVAMFLSGNLKVKKEHNKLQQLLAERNNIKGKEYRQEVVDWLKQNTDLNVYDFEVKISPKGFLKSHQDKGDIDILAVDDKKKIVYSLECKNTTQSKVAYEFHTEILTYLGTDGKEGLIQKHVNRHRWLNENKEMVLNKLGLAMDYQIVSLVISRHILPMKHLRATDIPVYSFYELKAGAFTFTP